MALEICAGCQQPITPAQWAVACRITREGARAHLACLERGLPVPIHTSRRDLPYYLLAGRTCSPIWLRPGARFQELRGAHVIIAVPLCELWAQLRLLAAAHQAHIPAGGLAPIDGIYAFLDDARAAAGGDPSRPTARATYQATVAGIWGPDDALPF